MTGLQQTRHRAAAPWWRLVVVAVLACLAAACSGPAVGQASPSADPVKDKLAQVLARGTLVAYSAEDYAPQSMDVEGATRPAATKCLPTQKTGDEMTGYDNETAKLVAKDLGVEACFVFPTWTELTAGAWGDRWDIGYGSGSINSDRMKRLYMTQPYYATPNRYFVRANSAFQTADELSGKRIGVCASCSQEYYLKHELDIPGVTLTWDIENPTLVAYETEAPGLKDVADGKLDAFLCAEPAGEGEIAGGLALRPLAKTAFTFYPTGFVDKQSGLDVGPFINRVNEIIRAHEADGSLKALSLQYLGKDYVTAAAAFDLATIGQTIP